MSPNILNKEQLKKIIVKNNTTRSDIPEGSSAVLIPIIEKDGELNIIFEERSHSLKFQPGDVCFPGGRVEGNESPQECAVRECMEELFPKSTYSVNGGSSNYKDNDSDHSKIEVFAALPPMIGPTGKIVYPFAGFMHDYEFTYSKDEVERIIAYPISFFKERRSDCDLSVF